MRNGRPSGTKAKIHKVEAADVVVAINYECVSLARPLLPNGMHSPPPRPNGMVSQRLPRRRSPVLRRSPLNGMVHQSAGRWQRII